eukprot:6477347-Prymnesium_polylepis.2
MEAFVRPRQEGCPARHNAGHEAGRESSMRPGGTLAVTQGVRPCLGVRLGVKQGVRPGARGHFPRAAALVGTGSQSWVRKASNMISTGADDLATESGALSGTAPGVIGVAMVVSHPVGKQVASLLCASRGGSSGVFGSGSPRARLAAVEGFEAPQPIGTARACVVTFALACSSPGGCRFGILVAAYLR